MNTTSAPAVTGERAEAVLRVFRESKAPLTVAQARKLYAGPKLPDKGWMEIIEGLLLEGQLFECFPSGKAKRYWIHDEEQRIREEIEQQLADRCLGQKPLADAVAKALKGISAKASVERCIQTMREERLLHPHPGKQRTQPALSLQPFDLLTAIQIKKTTLNDLGKVLERLSPFGLSIDQFLAVLKTQLQPQPAKVESQPVVAATPSLEQSETPAAMTDERVASSETSGPAPLPAEEIEQLIMKGMQDLEPNVTEGAPVLLRDLRRHMPEEYRSGAFDAAVLRLAERGTVVVHRHDQPSFLSEAERDELVRDEAGTYYTMIAQRV